ncbi:DUF320 domain-containing protein [Arthrobacter sp. B1I2]|uniref:DUF320 domain-containing protein n=1 Tax=Arthrobacter sp. B1I2 TaxID=3042263 RepID=UPI00278B8CA9|nr:DUF320 domain-containing protein [Arthrobacter sp. B1I2]MDQ0730056.1 hypothetical protein [Arthrobacter sp. B1I2]
MTHRNIRRCLLGTAFAGGLLAFGGVAATAADTTSGADGLLSGTQVVAPINIPINLGATSLGLLGDSAASVEGAGTPAAVPAPASAASTSGAEGILSGTQIVTPVTVPINLGATSLGLLGDSAAGVENTSAPSPAPTPTASTSGSDGVFSGTQIVAPISAPVNLGATSLGLLGDSAAGVENTSAPSPAPTPTVSTSGSDGVFSGTQIVAPITAPVNLGATSLGLLGDSAASAEGVGTPGTASAPASAPAPAASTSGADGILSGTQIVAPITVPINLDATSVGLLGDSAASTETSAPVAAPAPAPAATSGNDGILSGTQVFAPITVPISLGATSVGVTGDTTAMVVNPPVVTSPLVTPPVVNPPAVTSPVVTPPVVTPPVVTPPAVTLPVAALPASQPSAGSSEVRAATTNAAPTSTGFSSAPTVLANTGVDTGMLMVGLLLLAFGGVLTLVLRRKRS